MALPFRSIFGLADEVGNPTDSGLDRGARGGAAHPDGIFTVEAESLSEAIPPELKSGVATHAARVALKLEGARWNPGDAEVETRLIQIYRACPQLFAVAIDDGLDATVRLRLAGVVETVAPETVPESSGGDGRRDLPMASNPFRVAGAGNGPAEPPSNPFSKPLVQPMSLPPGPPPLPGGQLESPFKIASAPPLPESAAPPVSPFLAALTGAPAAETPKAGASQAEAASVAPEIPLEEETAPTKPEIRLSFPLHALLGSLDPGVLGINASVLPVDWKTHLPWSLLKPQFSSGRVMVTLSQLLEHADAPARVGLQGVNGGVEVVIPLKEIIRQLPASESLSDPAPVVVEEKAAVSPFAIQAKEESQRGFVPLKEAPPVMLDPTTPPVSPFRVATEMVPAKASTQPAGLTPKSGELDSLDDLDDEPQAPAMPEVRFVHEPVAEPVPAPPPVFTMAAPVPVAPVVAAAPVVPVTAPPTAPAVFSKPVSPAGSEKGWVRFDGIGFSSEIRDLELRAVFGRSDSFTRQLAVDLTASLPGVHGCVLFADAESGGVLAKCVGTAPEAGAMLERLPRMYQRIRGLAEDLGLESGETSTVRTNQGMVSFFAQGGICLGVLQAGEGSDAGFVERLLLVARGISVLRE
jgi:hypothetical protein